MPQMDIKPSDTDDGMAYLSVGWDHGDKDFLILYAKKDRKPHTKYTTVRLSRDDIVRLKLFLDKNFGAK
jgi:hypothetical protein